MRHIQPYNLYEGSSDLEIPYDLEKKYKKILKDECTFPDLLNKSADAYLYIVDGDPSPEEIQIKSRQIDRYFYNFLKEIYPVTHEEYVRYWREYNRVVGYPLASSPEKKDFDRMVLYLVIGFFTGDNFEEFKRDFEDKPTDYYMERFGKSYEVAQAAKSLFDGRIALDWVSVR